MLESMKMGMWISVFEKSVPLAGRTKELQMDLFSPKERAFGRQAS